ncbi:MAG: DUF935 domain-containing protein [Acidobacteriia bacterium]|nr:DUF935 domain-containing protein [Terriglobia bacterium]
MTNAANPKSSIENPKSQVGLTGTPIFGGFLSDFGEYNSQLEGLAAVRTYEKMRRSDAQVAATLLACELPIRAASWDVRPASDDPEDRAIAGFVRENLFGGLEYVSPSGVKTTQCWDDVLRNALLMLTFGAAAHEEIYAVDGAMVRLARLAPRLPLTFYRWITDSDGETLLALNQYGYRNASFESVAIPTDRLAVFTFNQEGSNFFGRSMLRPAYMHWYIKHQLYRIDAIAGERNGLGVPTIEQGPDSSREDRQAAAQWVQQLAAHEKTGVSLPNGWKFSLKGVEGNVRDLYNSIQHHNIEISRTALAFFMNLGLGARAGGNRSLGESQADFFFLAVQATADHLARLLSVTSVKRLVDYNWEGVGRYPTVVVSNLRARRFDQVLDLLVRLAQTGVVAPYPELTQFITRELGLPQRQDAGFGSQGSGDEGLEAGE